jgi:hypothetical protein
MATLTDEPKVLISPRNYEMIITRYSWWTSRSGKRKFVIVSIEIYWNDEANQWRPEAVALLEVERQEPIRHNWGDFIKLYDEGEIVKICDPTK